jgi:hypothetical protein
MRKKQPKPLGRQIVRKSEPALPRMPLLPAEVIAGRSYFCVVCKTCQQPIAFWEAEPNATMNHADDSFWFRQVPCPSCQTSHDYQATSIQLLVAQPEGPVQ